MSISDLQPIRIRVRDLLDDATAGTWARPLRTILSSIGIAIGIAALVAITGVAGSNKAQYLNELDRMGANLLTVEPGKDTNDKTVPLPATAPEMIERIAPVTNAAAVFAVPNTVRAYRTDHVPTNQTRGLLVQAAGPGLPAAIDADLAWGQWFSNASRILPTVVLGSQAAATLGIAHPGQRIWVADQWHSVIGVLQPVVLAEGIDHAVFLGDDWTRDTIWPQFTDTTGATPGSIATIYVNTHPGTAAQVRPVLAATANPVAPQYVGVSQLSDYADMRELADTSLTNLATALAAIALLIGGVGIANTMVVAVIERRGEIGLRLALGARRTHIATQFIFEALALATIGATIGVSTGVLATIGYAAVNAQAAALPVTAIVAAPVLALTVGIIAGAYPAWRATRLTPNEALRTA
ncbi:ABC transporter permease [Micromonospora sp. NPDC048170]|uniref:ABC transporter permease n=1 Tax=Micromonospora sp. NPDC048170 TaxID=3154819 RepID=UPI00340B0D40